MAQPTPSSSRFAPVMLARARSDLPGNALAGLPGEEQVDGVLGQHGDEGDDRDGEGSGDVVLCSLSPGRDHKSG